jgi:heme/copper-type cytochrome/quinol oxidase subunit 3
MIERTDSLLAELVELQRRQVTNQEHAIANQEKAHERMNKSIQDARRRSQILMWVFIVAVLLVFLPVPLLNLLARLGH